MSTRYQRIESGDDVYCPDCEETTTAGAKDIGHGPTEFWGSWSNHVEWVTCCARCGCEEVEIPEEEEA
jgi:hypothetical protein